MSTNLPHEPFAADRTRSTVNNPEDRLRPRGALTLMAALRILAILVAAPGTGLGQPPLNAMWSQQSGAPNNDFVLDVASDTAGHVYSAGVMVTGDPATGITKGVVVKLRSDGTEVWRRELATESYTSASSVAVDPLGNVFVGGNALGAFPGGAVEGRSDAFVAKYDSKGNQLWVRQFGTGDFDVASDLATDSTGNVYVGGWMSAASEDADSWLAKLDGSGNLLWVRAFGIPALDQVEGVSADPSGFVYVVGLVEGRFAGQTSASGWDAYIAKWDVAGNLVWLRQFGSEHTEQASAVALDASGIYISGEIDYGGGGGFLTKYDADGDQQWFERVGLGVGVWVSALAVDAPSAAIFVGGTAWGAFPGQSLRGPTDAFVARYGPDGQPHWIRQFGTDGVDNASGVATDGAGGIYIGGDTSGDAAGSYDGVLMRVHGRLQSLHVETPNTRTHWGIGTVQRIAGTMGRLASSRSR